MSGRPVPRTFALVCTVLLLGCASGPGGDPTDVRIDESFEDGLEGWQDGSDVPADPNREGQQVAWNITASDEQPATGNKSANFRLDGSQDDGTIWLVRPVQVDPGAVYEARIEAQAWSQDESFNHIADLVLYIGTTPPDGEESFPRGEDGGPGESEDGQVAGIREPLNKAAGWEGYNFNWTTPEDAQVLYVAVGISVVWETEVSYFVDDLNVRMVPHGQAGTGSY